MADEALLEVSGLRTYFDTDEGVARAVDGDRAICAGRFPADAADGLCVGGESAGIAFEKHFISAHAAQRDDAGDRDFHLWRRREHRE